MPTSEYAAAAIAGKFFLVSSPIMVVYHLRHANGNRFLDFILRLGILDIKQLPQLAA